MTTTAFSNQTSAPAPRVALITGADRGIGRATALALARDGVDVIITYRSHADEADEVVARVGELGRKAVAFRLDTGEVSSFDAFVAEVTDALQKTWSRGTFDFLINNAGMQITASFADATEEGFDRMVDVHLKGVFFLTQKLLSLLADGGSIVNISSGTTRVYTPERIVYGAVKGAIEVFTRYLAQEVGARGITVNTIAPGATATDFSDGVLRENQQLQEIITSVTALGRYGVAEDIAGAIAALLGDGNRWITGQRIEVSGGMHL
jgi:NAD(P)-dependent dehydrogenase (short-subunit alcohol dehydrogenase family)